MHSFNMNNLRNALENMPFFENELAYLCLSGQSETTFRDRLAYFLANQNHNEPFESWCTFFPKEAKLHNKQIDLAVIEGKGEIEERISAIIEFKHFYLTQILYGDEFMGRRGNNGVREIVLSDIKSRLEIIKKLSHRTIGQYQVLFISHYVPNDDYENVTDREEIYTHNVARFLHIKGKRKELGLIRKSKELEQKYGTHKNGEKDGIQTEIEVVLQNAFNDQTDFSVDVSVGILDKGIPHRYHYFNAKTYFAIIAVQAI